MKRINAEDLKKKIDSGEKFKIVDALGKESFEKLHIPKSINMPSDEVEQQAPTKLPDKNKEIVLYCADLECQASPEASKKLKNMGYTNLIEFRAGLAGWEEAGYKFEGTEPDFLKKV